MGGYVALNTAYQYPEKVNKIVTLGTKFNWDTISTRKEVAMLNPEKIEEKVPNYGQKLHSEHFPLDWKTVVKKTASMMIALSEGKCLKNDNFVQLYHEVVIGIGNLDKMVSYDESKLISSLLPNGKLVTLDGVPHPIDKIDVEKLALYIQNSC